MENGGKRPGAGRPKGISTKILERQNHAEKLLKKLGGNETWLWAMEKAKDKSDYQAVVEIMKYWTDRAKGKAPQAVQLESGDQPVELTVKFVGDRANPGN